MNQLQYHSSVLHCLFDQTLPSTSSYPAYSVFRAVSAQDVTQKPTSLPCVHDFAIIWDDDHDTRIIKLLEEMLFSGLLPGVQFIGEHKGTLTLILAAKTYFEIDIDDYKKRVSDLCGVTGDLWAVEIGMIDVTPESRKTAHQCDYQNLIGLPHYLTDAYLVTLDAMWQLGTKVWRSFQPPIQHGKHREIGTPPALWFDPVGKNRYTVRGN